MELNLRYVVGAQSSTTVWAPGTEPLPAKPSSGRGRPPKLLRRDSQHKPVSMKQLAESLPPSAWKKVTWRQGVEHALRSRFAAVRLHPAHRDYWQAETHPEEWLLVEWPKEEAEPTKYWLSTLPPETKLKDLVRIAKHRWLIERDYEELKQELGLGHFEGRGWRGFHHHATLCIAAYGFLVAERSRFPPQPASAHWNYPRQNSRKTSIRAAAPPSCGRHNPHSIATLRRTIAGFLIRQLPCCSFCGTKLL
jgi:SRSO17 transposase